MSSEQVSFEGFGYPPEEGQTLKIWQNDPKQDYPDLNCTVRSVDGPGKVEFFVLNGAWTGFLDISTKTVTIPKWELPGGKVFSIGRFEFCSAEDQVLHPRP